MLPVWLLQNDNRSALIDHTSSNYETPNPVNKSDQTSTVWLDSKRNEPAEFKFVVNFGYSGYRFNILT